MKDMSTSEGVSISDFAFIAHDATIKTKRQIPTFVRAHVMERYHRERRAKKGIKEGGKEGSSRQEFVPPAPAGHGMILKWDDDNLKGTGPLKGDRRRGKKNDAVDSRKGTKAKQDAGEKARRPAEPEHITKGVTAAEKMTCQSPDLKFEGLDYIRTNVISEIRQKFQRIDQVRSLMPNDEIERSGMSLVRILDNYYGVVDINQEIKDPWHTLWIPFAFSDQCLFHASVAKFAMHASASNGEAAQRPQLLRHKGLALAQLSSTISQPGAFPTDQIIAAGVCLVGTEMLNSDTAALKAHIQGVRKMIAVRGGLHNMNTDPMLIAGYLSYEYVLATIDEDLTDVAVLKSLDIPNPYGLKFPAQTGIFTLARKYVDPLAHGYSHDTVRLLKALCRQFLVSDVFVHGTQTTTRKVPSLGALIEELDRKSWVNEFTAITIPESNMQLAESILSLEDHVLQALLITTILQFPHLAPSSPLGLATHQQKIKLLRYHTSQSTPHLYWKPIPGALLWCLMVGTSGSKGLPERSYFISNMIRATCGIAFGLIEPVRAALATFYRVAQEQKH